jgi:mannose-6-phosphate isomerase-like protein (cupin superfamily)
MTSEQHETADARQAFHPRSSTDVVYWGRGDGATFLATGKDINGADTRFESVVAPGGGPPPHIHHHEDETFYLLERSLQLRLGESTVVAQAGDYMRVPRGMVHAFRNVGEHMARMLVRFVPGGVEDFFIEVYQPIIGLAAPPPESPADMIERIRRAAPRYDLEIVPSLESGADSEPGLDAPNCSSGMQH